MINRIQNRLEQLMAFQCKSRLRVTESNSVPKEARSVMEEGYLDADNLRRSLAALREEQRLAQNLFSRRNKFFEDWETRKLPEPPEVPLLLLADSWKDIEQLSTKIMQLEHAIRELLQRYRFPDGRPLPAIALGQYQDGQITIYNPVLAKVADDFAVSKDRLIHLMLVYFLTAGIAHIGLDADNQTWDTWPQADPMLRDAIYTYYTFCYAEKHDATLLDVLQLWLKHRPDGNPQWVELKDFPREQVRTAFICLRKHKTASWQQLLDLLGSLSALDAGC
jgi:hypothetical protein